MITTLMLNPVLDITLEMDKLMLDDYNVVKNVSRIPGVKGINV